LETGQKSGPIARYLSFSEQLEQPGSPQARRLAAAAEGQIYNKLLFSCGNQ
jgi:hypothetical protein